MCNALSSAHSQTADSGSGGGVCSGNRDLCSYCCLDGANLLWSRLGFSVSIRRKVVFATQQCDYIAALVTRCGLGSEAELFFL